jgi:vitamin B12 transporter
MTLRIWAALPVVAISAPVWGQSQTQYVDVLPSDSGNIQGQQIVVTGAALRDPAGDAAYSVQKIDLESNASQRLENVLTLVAGLQQFRRSDARSANPTSQGITMRGLGGNASSRAILTLDGVPQADPFGGWISWPGYDAVRLSDARVRRGGGAGSDGPGALAGATELNSDQSTGEPRSKLSASYGSRKSADMRASVNTGIGAGVVSFAGSYSRGDGFIPIVRLQRGLADRAAKYEQGGISVRAAIPFGDASLQGAIRAFTDQRTRGFAFSDNQNSGIDASIRLVRNSGDWQWSALAYLQVREFANRFGGVAPDRNSVVLVLDQFSVPSEGIGARFELRPPIGDAAELRLGADWRQTTGNTRENFFFTGTVPGRSRNAGGKTDTVGGFAEISYEPFARFTVTGSVRADRWNITDGFRREINIGGSIRSDDRFADRSGWETTARAGFAYHITSAWKLRGAAYQGWRLPTLNELYRPFRVGSDATAANELLKPERLQGAEIGVDFGAGGTDFGLTVFANKLDDAIANVGLGRGPGLFPGVGFVATGGIYRKRQNLEAINSKGIEIDFSHSIGNLRVRASYAYVDSSVDGSGASVALDGLRPAQVPRHFANLHAEYTGGKLRLGGGLRYVGNQFEDDANSIRLRAALTMDGLASYEISQRISLELRGENLLNREVQAAVSNAGIVERTAPRSISAGISLQY